MGEIDKEIPEPVECDTQTMIKVVCLELEEMLLEKNRCYGDSAMNPVRIFSKSDAMEQLNVRIDDKLNRIMQGDEFAGDDSEWDLTGYLILKRIKRRIYGNTSLNGLSRLGANVSDSRGYDNVLEDVGERDSDPSEESRVCSCGSDSRDVGPDNTPKPSAFRRPFYSRSPTRQVDQNVTGNQHENRG